MRASVATTLLLTAGFVVFSNANGCSTPLPAGTDNTDSTGGDGTTDPENDTTDPSSDPDTPGDGTTDPEPPPDDTTEPPEDPAPPSTGSTDEDPAPPEDPTTVDEPAPVEVTVTIEPDDFPDGTDLTEMNPNVTLWTTGDNNQPVPLFFVSASDDGQDLAPTGVRVFGHANVPFFNSNRRLRMNFASPAKSVSILFAGGNLNGTEKGRLRVYDDLNRMLAEYITSPRGPGESELMTISREEPDIAWAIAFLAPSDGSFGRLDELTFTFMSP